MKHSHTYRNNCASRGAKSVRPLCHQLERRLLFASPIYTSAGFESPRFLKTFVNLNDPTVIGNLRGQDALNSVWKESTTDPNGGEGAVTGTAVVETKAEGSGSDVQDVKVTRTQYDDRWTPLISYTQNLTNPVVRIAWSMKVAQTLTDPTRVGPFFGIEAFDRTGGPALRIGGFGADGSTGEILYEDPALGLTPTAAHNAVAFNFYYNYEMVLDYNADTYSIILNGTVLKSAIPFLTPGITGLTDADISALRAQPPGQGNEDGVAFFDNYLIDLPFAYVSGGTLFVNYQTGQDTATFTQDGLGNIVVTEDTSLSFAPGTFSNIVIRGTAGVDHAVVSAPLSIKPLTFIGQTGNDTIVVTSGGSVAFAADAGAQSASLAVTVNSGASASFTGNQKLASLTVNGFASLNGGPGRILNSTTLAVGGPSGKLDLQNNKLITSSPVGTLAGSTYTGVTALLQSGYNAGSGGGWNGATGIVTTSAVGHYTSLGVAKASEILRINSSQTGVWYGQTVTGSQTLVMYTYGGDATLDGKLNIDDYVHLDQGIAAHLSGYSNGDFNFDGKVNIDDYTMFIDANIGAQGPPF